MAPGFRLRHLAFHGPVRGRAIIEFGPGMNVVYGASDTGKSFIVESVDFMLGGKPPLRDIPERQGYDRVYLGIETLEGKTFTLMRSVDGGRFLLYEGLHSAPPGEGIQGEELAEVHSDRAKSVSSFLLEHCGLSGKRIRRNKQGDTNSLSFRNLARLMIVTETEITAQRSPLSDGNPIADTPNFSSFKLLLTGVDDSALVSRKPGSPEESSREAQIELLDQMISDYRNQLKQNARRVDELEDQLGRLDHTIAHHGQQLTSKEAGYRKLVTRRRELRTRLEEGEDRQAEIRSLLERFDLLERHYVSDIERLRGIEEAGTLFSVLGPETCPLCGSLPEHQRHEAECEANTDAVAAAARAEIGKIEVLRSELKQTISVLTREGAGFDRRLPSVEEEIGALSQEIEHALSPQLTQLRQAYSEVSDKRAEVREAIAFHRTLQDMEKRRQVLQAEESGTSTSAVSDGDLPTAIAQGFASQVEAILKAWDFPGVERVFFDSKARDLVIADKQRSARGKGLRAITHAAFTLGILEYCRAQSTPHPGFVVLDSPLLAYRAPEGDDLDVAETDLKEKFYTHIAQLPADRQVIIVENTDPPTAVIEKPQVTMFSRNPKNGRYGFFPHAVPPSQESPESGKPGS